MNRTPDLSQRWIHLGLVTGDHLETGEDLLVGDPGPYRGLVDGQPCALQKRIPGAQSVDEIVGQRHCPWPLESLADRVARRQAVPAQTIQRRSGNLTPPGSLSVDVSSLKRETRCGHLPH